MSRGLGDVYKRQVIKMMMGKWQEPSPIMYGIAVFMLMFYLGPGDTSTFGWLFDTIGI